MTPKEKAKELFDKFNLHVLQKDFFGDDVEIKNTKECILICVEEILNTIPMSIYFDDFQDKKFENPDINWWKEVKQEIKNL